MSVDAPTQKAVKMLARLKVSFHSSGISPTTIPTAST
jgi:hypothetical protein